MIMMIYERALKVLMQKPLRLWGISLLAVLLAGVGSALCGVAIPILGIAVSLLLSTAMLMVYLAGYRGDEVHVVDLFACFKDWNTAKRVLLGMGWMAMWVFLWALIPIVGPIFALIRIYEYKLTPYILLTEPDVAITDAIKVSAQRTKGYKLKMWLAEWLYGLLFGLVVGILALLALIPFVGVIFGLVIFLLTVVFIALSPLFLGLVQAAFYEEITHPTQPDAPVTGGFCTVCGTALVPGAKFCAGCGSAVGKTEE